VRVLDKEINKLLRAAAQSNAIILITSDHGNIEVMLNARTGEIETQHDASPVPFYIIASELQGRRFPNSQSLATETIGILSDVAPTILELMQIPKPGDMTGQSLLRHIL
jgi:2,3-bisphosphoglycerate-independent phosphoglycerate mutase